MAKRAQIVSAGKQPLVLERKKSKEFYQTKEWKRFREAYRKEKRKEHEQIVMNMYRANKENRPKDLLEFITTDTPLSEVQLKKGIIKVANVLDHKIPIRKGGAKLSRSNVRWITEHEHAVKSGKEAHE